jgi:hypothetical protein
VFLTQCLFPDKRKKIITELPKPWPKAFMTASEKALEKTSFKYKAKKWTSKNFRMFKKAVSSSCCYADDYDSDDSDDDRFSAITEDPVSTLEELAEGQRIDMIVRQICRLRSPAREIAIEPEVDDECFFIEMSEQEEESKTEFAQQLNELLKTGSHPMVVISEDNRKINITANIMADIFNDYLDKREAERASFIDIIVAYTQKGLLGKCIILEALGLLGKLVPGLLLDVPDVCGYIGEFCCK